MYDNKTNGLKLRATTLLKTSRRAAISSPNSRHFFHGFFNKDKKTFSVF